MFTLRTLSVATCGLVFSLLLGGITTGQDEKPVEPSAPATPVAAENALDGVQQKAEQVVDEAKKQVDELAKKVDQIPRAKEISAGILQPIYQVAEHLSFPMFHWLAFTIMAAGVVSYALQLVLGKLVVLTKLGFSPAEILSDAHGLLISAVGLVLTTQAAAENSSFTQSAFAVISATVVGVIVGFIFYRWGQSQEVQATMARRAAGSNPKQP